MLNLSSSDRYILYSHSTDMRKSFDGLSGVVRDQMNLNPMSGKVYIFVNKGRDKIKLLRWIGFGYIQYYKRLESGSYELPSYDKTTIGIELSYTQVVMLIDGLSIKNITRRKRYDYPQKQVDKSS